MHTVMLVRIVGYLLPFVYGIYTRMCKNTFVQLFSNNFFTDGLCGFNCVIFLD